MSSSQFGISPFDAGAITACSGVLGGMMVRLDAVEVVVGDEGLDIIMNDV